MMKIAWPPITAAISIISVLPIYLRLLIPLADDSLCVAHSDSSSSGHSRASALGVLVGALVSHATWSWLAIAGEEARATTMFRLLPANLVLTPCFFFSIYSLRLLIGIFQQHTQQQQSPYICKPAVRSTPQVAVVIACRNEPFEVTRMTLESALELDYPPERLRILVADNSDENHPALSKLREYIRSQQDSNKHIHLLHRQGIEGFKAGNLDLALRNIDSELTLFLDVDSTVQPSVLREHVGAFAEDPRLALLQFFNVPTNGNASSLATLAAFSLYLHKYKLLLRSETGGWPFFQGHNCLWRTSILTEIAPLSEHLHGQPILAEDTSMTLRANRLGFHGRALATPAGFWVSARLSDLESMLVRWAYGGSQILVREARFLSGGDRTSLLLGEHIDVLYQFLYPKTELVFPFLLPAIDFTTPSTAFLLFIWAANRLLLDLVMIILRPAPLQFLDRNGVLSMAHFSLFTNFVSWCELRASIEFMSKRRPCWIPTGKMNSPAETVNNPSGNQVWRPFLVPLTVYGFILLIIIQILLHFAINTNALLAWIPLLIQTIGVIATIIIYAPAQASYPTDLDIQCSCRRWSMHPVPTENAVR